MSAAPHQRVAADLRRRIAAEWPPGTQLPSRARLAVQYGVSPGTVRRAVEILRRSGELEGRQRQRPQVPHPPAVRTLVRPDADWPYGREIVAAGTRQPTDGIAERLRVPPGRRLRWERAELLDPGGRTAMLATTWWPAAPQSHASAVCELEHHTLTADEADALGLMSGTVVYLLSRTRLSAAGSPVETADLLLPMDRWRIRL